MGDSLPYGELGYWDLEDFIIDIPEVVSWDGKGWDCICTNPSFAINGTPPQDSS
jgi:hypothetical protein